VIRSQFPIGHFINAAFSGSQHSAIAGFSSVNSLDKDGKVQIDFTLQQLIEHFTIPDVPDVATLNPELHQRNLDLLHEIEEIIAL
jgi:hypothetical protein